MDKGKLLTKLQDIYKIIDALMIAAFAYFTSMFLLVLMWQNFDVNAPTLEADRVVELAKSFEYYTYIVGWITVTRVLTAFKIFFFPKVV